MEFETMYSLISSLWVVWFTALFTGIVVWAFRPSRRKAFEDHGNIPFKGDA